MDTPHGRVGPRSGSTPRRAVLGGAVGISSLLLPSASAAASDGWLVPGSGAVTAETGAIGDIRTSFIAGDYVVMGTYTSPPRVVMLRRSDLVRVGALTLTGEAKVRASVTAGGFGYFPTDASPARIVKVDLSNLTVVGGLTLASGENTVLSATSDGTHGYFATFTTPTRVVKVRLSDLTRVGASTLSVNDVITAANDGVHGYFGSYTWPGWISKVRLSDLTEVATRSLASVAASSPLMVESIAVHDGFGYCCINTSPGRIVKVRLDDLTIDSHVTLQAGDDQPGLLGHDGTHLLVGCFYVAASGSVGGRVLRVRMSDLARVGAIDLPAGETRLSTGAFDGTHSFYGGDTTVATVVKVAMDGPTRVAGVALTG